MDLKIQSNEQGTCPVCKSTNLEICGSENVDESGYYEEWQCSNCECTGKQYFEFADHYDVYAKDGETRIDKEEQNNFPYLKKDRLLILLDNALTVIHELTGEESGYANLHDLQCELGIAREEYAAITKLKTKKTMTRRTTKMSKFDLAFEKGCISIMNEYNQAKWNDDDIEPLDGDEVDALTERIRNRLNLMNGNITGAEYEELEGRVSPSIKTGIHQCLMCNKSVDIAKSNYWSAPSIDNGSDEPLFCSETCIVDYFGLRWIENKKNDNFKIVKWNNEEGVRKFKCFNIKHDVGTSIASDILEDMLNSVGLQLALSGDFEEELYDLIENAKIRQLRKQFEEIIIEVHGEIDDEHIEDMLCNEISEITNFLHEGFEFVEIIYPPHINCNHCGYKQHDEQTIKSHCDKSNEYSEIGSYMCGTCMDMSAEEEF